MNIKSIFVDAHSYLYLSRYRGSAVTRIFIGNHSPLLICPPIPDPERASQFIYTMADAAPGIKGEVWMLDTFGNVHSLVNACKQLGFKVNRVTDPKQLQSANVLPP